MKTKNKHVNNVVDTENTEFIYKYRVMHLLAMIILSGI